MNIELIDRFRVIFKGNAPHSIFLSSLSKCYMITQFKSN